LVLNKKLCFVLIPFGKDRTEPVTNLTWDEFFEYVLKPALLEINPDYEYKRSDTTPSFGELFSTAIVHNICNANMIIAVLTRDLGVEGGHPNANVIYELGLVHTLGKHNTLVLVDDEESTRVPFDLSQEVLPRYKKWFEDVVLSGRSLERSKQAKEIFAKNLKPFLESFERLNLFAREKDPITGLQSALASFPLREKLIILSSGRGLMMQSTLEDAYKNKQTNPQEKKRIGLDLKTAKNNPKSLLELYDGKTVLDCEIEAFKRIGFLESDIIVVGGFQSHKLHEKIQKLDYKIEYLHNRHWEDDEILGSIIAALDQREKLEEGFVVAYGDLFFENPKDLERLYETKKPISLLVEPRERALGYRYTKTREDWHPWVKEAEMVITEKEEPHRLRRIGKAPRVLPGEQVYGEFVGVARFTRAGVSVLKSYLQDMGELLRSAYLTKFMQLLIDNGEEAIIEIVDIDSRWWEIDIYEDLKNTREKSNVKEMYCR